MNTLWYMREKAKPRKLSNVQKRGRSLSHAFKWKGNKHQANEIVQDSSCLLDILCFVVAVFNCL